MIFLLSKFLKKQNISNYCLHKCTLHKHSAPWSFPKSELLLLPLYFFIFPYLLKSPDFRWAVKKIFIQKTVVGLKIGIGCCPEAKVNIKCNCQLTYIVSTSLKKMANSPDCGKLIVIKIVNIIDSTSISSEVSDDISTLVTFIRVQRRIAAMLLYENNWQPKNILTYDNTKVSFDSTNIFLILFYYIKILRKMFFPPSDWRIQISQINDKEWRYLFSEDAPSNADPFLFDSEDRVYCFFESFIRGKEKGSIRSISWNKNEVEFPLNFDDSSLVLADPNHYSFPFIFKHKNEFHILPESTEKGKIFLLSSKSLDGPWERSIEIDLPYLLLDPIIYFENGLWKLIGSIRNPLDSHGSSILVQFKSKNFDGGWDPVPKIISWSDRTARNAGDLLTIADGKFRLTQSFCRGTYGHHINSLHLSEELELTNEIKVFDFIEGARVHHFSKSDAFSARDVYGL